MNRPYYYTPTNNFIIQFVRQHIKVNKRHSNLSSNIKFNIYKICGSTPEFHNHIGNITSFPQKHGLKKLSKIEVVKQKLLGNLKV